MISLILDTITRRFPEVKGYEYNKVAFNIKVPT